MGFWNDRNRVKMRRPFINSNAGASAASHDHLVGSVSNPTPPAATGFVYLGTYTGTGNIAEYVAVTTDAVDMKYVRIWERETSATSSPVMESTALMVDNSGNGMAYNINTGQTQLDAIIILRDKGFFVDDGGGDSFPNSLGTVYEYMAIAVPE